MTIEELVIYYKYIIYIKYCNKRYYFVYF